MRASPQRPRLMRRARRASCAIERRRTEGRSSMKRRRVRRELGLAVQHPCSGHSDSTRVRTPWPPRSRRRGGSRVFNPHSAPPPRAREHGAYRRPGAIVSCAPAPTRAMWSSTWQARPADLRPDLASSRGLGRTGRHDTSRGRQAVRARYTVAEREYRRERTGDPRPLLVGDEAEPGCTDAAVPAAMHTAARECEVEAIKLKGLTVNDVPAVGKEHLGYVFDVDVEAHARRRYRSLPSPDLRTSRNPSRTTGPLRRGGHTSPPERHPGCSLSWLVSVGVDEDVQHFTDGPFPGDGLSQR